MTPWTLGNHEFNFGKDVFTGVLEQATFPLLQANVQTTARTDSAAQDPDLTSKRPSAETSMSPSSASATTASRTTNCRATSQV